MDRDRTSKTLNGVTDVYAVDDGDKLLSVSRGGSVVKAYAYDGAGRTTAVTSSAGTTTLGYDYEGRVTGIAYPNSTASATFGFRPTTTRARRRSPRPRASGPGRP